MAYTFELGEKSLQSILDDYSINCSNEALKYYASLPDWETALEEAGRFRFNASGRCHDHQYRIYRIVKEQFLDDLRENSAEIQNSANFEELYDNIERFCKKNGIGELAVYDTALRLGAFLEKHKGGSFKPHEVFLHNGAMKGAMVLFGRKLLARPCSRMPLSEFAELFPNKEAWEVEEILCIYKDNF